MLRRYKADRYQKMFHGFLFFSKFQSASISIRFSEEIVLSSNALKCFEIRSLYDWATCVIKNLAS